MSGISDSLIIYYRTKKKIIYGLEGVESRGS